MVTGLRYRVTSALGTVVCTVLAVLVANHPLIQRAFVRVPVVRSLPAQTLSNGDLVLAIATALVVTVGALVPLFKPQPRRILDTISLTSKRVILGAIALAAIGYFDYTYRLPRTTLLLVTGLLLLWLPAWNVAIRRRPPEPVRTILVGNDLGQMEGVLSATDVSIVGYVSPMAPDAGSELRPESAPTLTDGGQLRTSVIDERFGRSRSIDSLENLGGLSHLDEIIRQYDVDTALLAFERPDRAEFFGVLDICSRLGVTAMIHRDHAGGVLTAGAPDQELIEVDLDPWDWQDHVVKRAFDVGFALATLTLLVPVLAVVVVAIKLDSPGPVLYSQQRTAEFGETFTVYKFRSMIPEAESNTGAKLSEEDAGGTDPRVTRIGRFLRQTHLDEIPQLWSILKGDMSVVGPRPERPELDTDIESGVDEWRRRWFVKPGLTGLAQIRGVTGHEPARKLQYDIEYVRRQSFWFDLKIVIRQLWMVAQDAADVLRREQ